MNIRTRTHLEPEYESGFVQKSTVSLDDVVNNHDVVLGDCCVLRGRHNEQLDHVYDLFLKKRFDEAVDFLRGGVGYLESMLEHVRTGRIITTKSILEEFRRVPEFVFNKISKQPQRKNLWQRIDTLSDGQVTHYCDLHFDIRGELRHHLFENDSQLHREHLRLVNRFKNSKSCYAQKLRNHYREKNVSLQDINLYVAALALKKIQGAQTSVLTADKDFLHQGPLVEVTSKNQRKKWKVPSRISIAPDIDISNGINRYGVPRAFAHYENTLH